jgi:signal transduction histidine kinase
VIAVIGLFMVLLTHFARQEDRTFAEDSHQLARSALEGRERALGHLTLDYAMWNDAFASVSQRWNGTWVRNAYYSSVIDAFVIARTDGSVRYNWTADGMDGALTPALLSAFLNTVQTPDPTAADPESLVRSGVFAFGDGIAIVSVAAITPEGGDRRASMSPATTDFLISAQVLDAAEISAFGDTLGLEDFMFVARPNTRADVVTLPLMEGENGRGALSWRHERPGSAAFDKLVLPLLICVLMIGGLAALVARNLVAAQVRALTQAQSALDSDRVRSDFIASMSHEFRTPLNAIIGYAELVQEELSEAQRRSDIGIDTSHILKAARHLLRLVNDILDHTRIDAGHLHLATDNLPVTSVIESIEDLARPLALANHNRFLVVNEAKDMVVLADETRLRQCLINLVGNSMKFTRNGDVRLEVRSRTDGKATFVVFEVIDNGIGISKETMAKLFQPFAQAVPGLQTKFGGAGLGLSITRKVAGAMGGTIVAHSDGDGLGAKFTLALPGGPLAAAPLTSAQAEAA